MSEEELTKLNELVPHKGLLPTFNEIVNQLEIQKLVLDKIKEETKLAYNELQPGELVIGQALLKNILELLEEIE